MVPSPDFSAGEEVVDESAGPNAEEVQQLRPTVTEVETVPSWTPADELASEICSLANKVLRTGC